MQYMCHTAPQNTNREINEIAKRRRLRRKVAEGDILTKIEWIEVHENFVGQTSVHHVVGEMPLSVKITIPTELYTNANRIEYAAIQLLFCDCDNFHCFQIKFTPFSLCFPSGKCWKLLFPFSMLYCSLLFLFHPFCSECKKTNRLKI